MREERFKRDFYTRRVDCIWHKQPEEPIEADMIMTFKRHLARYMIWKDLEGCGPNEGKLGQLGLHGQERPVLNSSMVLGASRSVDEIIDKSSGSGGRMKV